MSGWRADAFSNAAVMRASMERRYMDDPGSRLPDNNTRNADQVSRRPGEHVAGWTTDAQEYDDYGAPLDTEADSYADDSGYTPSAQTALTSTAGLWAGSSMQQQATATSGRPAGPSAGPQPAPVLARFPVPSELPRQVYPTGAIWQVSDAPTQLAPTREASMRARIRAGIIGGGGTQGGASSNSGGGSASSAPTDGYDLDGRVFGPTTLHNAGMPEDTDDVPMDLSLLQQRRGAEVMDGNIASNTYAWRGLVAGEENAAMAMARTGDAGSSRWGGGRTAWNVAAIAKGADPAGDYDARWHDGKFGHGDQVDATFVGVYVDPLTNKEYDQYENAVPPPTGDYRVRDSGMQRRFDGLMGGWAPGTVLPKRAEHVNDDDPIPDVPERDWVEYGRSRGAEYAAHADLHGPHMDDAAWRDAEGYASLPKREMPGNRAGLNDAYRFTAYPDLHLHAGLATNPERGAGISPGENGFAEGSFQRPKYAVRVKKTYAVDTHGGVSTDAEAAYYAPQHIEETLSNRKDMVAALGAAFANISGAVEGAGTGGLVDYRAPLGHNDFAAVGYAILDSGILGAGMGGDTSFDTTTHRETDLRARAVGDVGMALLSSPESGVYMPPEFLELPQSERDLVTLALGRAMLGLVSNAEAEAGYAGWSTAPRGSTEAYTDWGTTVDAPQRSPEFLTALGQYAVQVAVEAGIAPPGDWDASQSGGRDLNSRAKAVGSRLAGILAAVEGAGMGGLSKQERLLSRLGREKAGYRADMMFHVTAGNGDGLLVAPGVVDHTKRIRNHALVSRQAGVEMPLGGGAAPTRDTAWAHRGHHANVSLAAPADRVDMPADGGYAQGYTREDSLYEEINTGYDTDEA